MTIAIARAHFYDPAELARLRIPLLLQMLYQHPHK